MVHRINYTIFDKFPEIECHTIWEDNFPESDSVSDHPGQEQYWQILKAAGGSPGRVAFAEQVHGDVVLPAQQAGIQSGCDGLVSNRHNIYLLIRTADCAAVMIYEPKYRVIGNWHAGWRGIKSGIIGKGIELMKRQWDCRPGNIRVAVSPCIQDCCYRVGEEFRGYFPPQYLHRRKNALYFDLKKAVFDQLVSSGVPVKNIEMDNRCTYCNPEQLPSYRRNGTKNRLLNVIKIKEV